MFEQGLEIPQRWLDLLTDTKTTDYEVKQQHLESVTLCFSAYFLKLNSILLPQRIMKLFEQKTGLTFVVRSDAPLNEKILLSSVERHGIFEEQRLDSRYYFAPLFHCEVTKEDMLRTVHGIDIVLPPFLNLTTLIFQRGRLKGRGIFFTEHGNIFGNFITSSNEPHLRITD